MKRSGKALSLLLAVCLSFSFCACGSDPKAPPDEGTSLDADRSDGEDQSAFSLGDFIENDPVFPGSETASFYFDSLENYRALRDAAAKEGAEKECLSLAKDLGNPDVSDVRQVEALISEIGDVKILFPESGSRQLESFVRTKAYGSDPTLQFCCRDPAVGEVSFTVHYFENRAHTPREYYRKVFDDSISCFKYVTPEPFFTVPFASGEIFLFYDYINSVGAFLLTENSEIDFSFRFSSAKTNEEKETAVRAFLEGMEIVTVNDAAEKAAGAGNRE